MLVQDLQSHVSKTIEASIGEFFKDRDVKYAADRESDRKSRKKGVKKVGDGWEERYPLTIRHYGTIYGRNASVAIEGCTRSFEIFQNANRPLFNRWEPKRKLPDKPAWRVRMIDGTPKTGEILYDMDSEDFESTLQKVIVMMVGHAFMEASV